MNTLKKIILFAFTGTLIVSCKKEQVPPSSVMGQPLFSFVGTVGSNSLDLKAGVNNYYMYSSFTQDSVGHDSVVYGFTGNLQSTSTNRNSIQITINDYIISAKNASVKSHIDSSFLRPSYYFFKPQSDTTGYLVKFTPIIYSGTPIGYTYIFGDGSTSSLAAPSHLYPYTASATYTTSLNVDFSSCGPVVVTNPISIIKGVYPPIIDSINSALGSDSVHLYPVTYTAAISNGTAPYTYLWSFGDGDSTTLIASTHTVVAAHTYSVSSTFHVNLTVKDNVGNSGTYNYSVEDSISHSGCLMDYKMSVPSLIIASNSYPLSDIAIVYTDGNGNVYTSDNVLQPNTSTFTISSVSDYKNNLNNQATKELTVKFSCTLYNTLTGLTLPASGTAVIAVAYQ